MVFSRGFIYSNKQFFHFRTRVRAYGPRLTLLGSTWCLLLSSSCEIRDPIERLWGFSWHKSFSLQALRDFENIIRKILEDTKILETCSGRFVLNRRIWKIIVRSRGKFLLYFSLLTCFPSNILLFRNNFFLTIPLQNSNAFLTITYIFNNRLLCRQLLESCRLNFEQRIVILRIFS